MKMKSDAKFEEIWLVVSKMTWGKWQILPEHWKVSNLGFLWNSCLNYKMYELKIYRGVLCHDNEEWYKIWRGIDLSFQNWHEEFDKFWPDHLKNVKKLLFNWLLWPTYIMFELKNYRGVIFDSTEE